MGILLSEILPLASRRPMKFSLAASERRKVVVFAGLMIPKLSGCLYHEVVVGGSPDMQHDVHFFFIANFIEDSPPRCQDVYSSTGRSSEILPLRQHHTAFLGGRRRRLAERCFFP